MVSSLQVIDRIEKFRGGSVQALLSTARHLRRAGADVEVAGTVRVAKDSEYLASEFPDLTVRVFKRTFPSRFGNSKGCLQWFELNHRRFGIVDIHSVFSILTWRFARRCAALNIPYVIRPHGSLDAVDVLKRANLKKICGPLFVRKMLDNASAVLLTTKTEESRLIKYGARPTTVVLPLAVDLSAIPGDRSKFRSQHGIAPDAEVVLFLSRIDYIKGLEILIPALKKLKRTFPKLWFVLGGTGDAAFVQKVRDQLREHGVLPWTSEIGFVSGADKADAFAAADLFVLPSRKENFGIVNIEAMHAGVPVVVSDQVQICQEILDARAGSVCQTTMDSLVLEIGRLLDGTVDRKLMGRRGRELVAEHYDAGKATTALLSLYQRICNGPAPR